MLNIITVFYDHIVKSSFHKVSSFRLAISVRLLIVTASTILISYVMSTHSNIYPRRPNTSTPVNTDYVPGMVLAEPSKTGQRMVDQRLQLLETAMMDLKNHLSRINNQLVEIATDVKMIKGSIPSIPTRVLSSGISSARGRFSDDPPVHNV